jgi:hypothetical protein
MRRIEAAALAFLLLLCASTVQAAELVMFRRAGCAWCLAWDRDIGPIYGRTDIGQNLPLRFTDLDRGSAAVALARPVRFTPTFVLVDAGREIGRIEGYPGEDFFWGLLERLVQRIPARPQPSRQSSAAEILPNHP